MTVSTITEREIERKVSPLPRSSNGAIFVGFVTAAAFLRVGSIPTNVGTEIARESIQNQFFVVKYWFCFHDFLAKNCKKTINSWFTDVRIKQPKSSWNGEHWRGLLKAPYYWRGIFRFSAENSGYLIDSAVHLWLRALPSYLLLISSAVYTVLSDSVTQ